ncbi:vesicle-associated membrane protein 4 [Patagioenas fasciata monilis]|uniref:Vesicle-associated membrane protein 4 n=2 Tax=Patagioenas fasciata TaxID=372321 RepID=A0A1V4JY90_PATFA|nr:vesicle-associated membrane protein 4 [Patagioenas fasciata monilis]
MPGAEPAGPPRCWLEATRGAEPGTLPIPGPPIQRVPGRDRPETPLGVRRAGRSAEVVDGTADSPPPHRPFPAGPERRPASSPGHEAPCPAARTMPPKFKRHLNDDEVTGSVKSERRNLLEEDSDEEEDFFLRGPSGPRFGPRNDKIRHVQNQVDEVIDVMQENITKVIERGERLDDLQDKSESLSDNATAFSNRAKQLRRQMWWRGCKMKAIIALVVVILLLVIIVPLVLKYHT